MDMVESFCWGLVAILAGAAVVILLSHEPCRSLTRRCSRPAKGTAQGEIRLSGLQDCCLMEQPRLLLLQWRWPYMASPSCPFLVS